jgi:hypothetical protein
MIAADELPVLGAADLYFYRTRTGPGFNRV